MQSRRAIDTMVGEWNCNDALTPWWAHGKEGTGDE
jgi:hypothetical protein